MVEFISYDERFPCLCLGTLIIKVDGEIYSFKNAMISGGSIWGCSHIDWDDMWSRKGDWKIDLEEHPELEQYKEEIIQVVNDNVKHGCCSGCI